MQHFIKSIHWLKNEIRGWMLLRGFLVLLPSSILFMWTQNSYWLEVSVLTMSALIVEEKIQTTIVGTVLHGLAVTILFYFLFFTHAYPLAFIMVSTLAAMAFIWLISKGEHLRPLGTWIFIPAIILSIEFNAKNPHLINWREALIFFPYLLSALFPVFLLTVFKQIKNWQQGAMIPLTKLTYLADFGEKKPYLESMLAMAMGVSISACLVEYLPLNNGQWMIWGVGSVITGDINTTPQKFQQRLLGVSIGVPIGIFLGQFVIPSTRFDLTLTTTCLFLTLVAFRRYVLAYTLRCIFVTTAVMLITHSKSLAFERFSHVVLGGAIGWGCVVFCHFLKIDKH